MLPWLETDRDVHTEAGFFFLKNELNFGCPGQRNTLSQSTATSRILRHVRFARPLRDLRVGTPNLVAIANKSSLRILWKSGVTTKSELRSLNAMVVTSSLLDLFFEPFMALGNAANALSTREAEFNEGQNANTEVLGMDTKATQKQSLIKQNRFENHKATSRKGLDVRPWTGKSKHAT